MLPSGSPWLNSPLAVGVSSTLPLDLDTFDLDISDLDVFDLDIFALFSIVVNPFKCKLDIR